MPLTTFTGLSGSITVLNQNFASLGELRELISTPGYAAATPKITMVTGGNLNFGGNTAPPEIISVEKAATIPRVALLRTGVGTWYMGGPETAGNGFEIRFNALTPAFASDGATVTLFKAAATSGGKLEVGGNIAFNAPLAAPTLGTNLDVSFQALSNTQLKVFMRGTDGVTRSTVWNLA